MNDRLNKDLLAIALKRNELSRLSYNSPEYDLVEEELHDLEDEFDDNHGKFLEKILTSIYKKIASGNEVMLPIAYIAKKYIISPDPDTGNSLFEAPLNEGIIIESATRGKEVLRLVLVPNPARIMLQEGKNTISVVWTDA